MYTVYDKLRNQQKMFELYGETGRVLLDQYIPALRGAIKTAKYVAEVDARIQSAFK